MIEKKEYIRLLNYAYRYLSYRMRTEHEVRIYLLGKAQKLHINENCISEVISTLKEEHYLDDQKFVEEFVHSRTKSKPKSEYALTVELAQKGISNEVIEEYFKTHTLDELKLAYEAIQRKWQVFNTFPKEKKLQKAYSFLQRRGFSFSVIKKTIEQLESSE